MVESKRTSVRIMQLLRDSLSLDLPDTDTDLVDSGLIDSAGFMELFVTLEKEFSIRIERDDLDLDNFRTVDRLAAFVNKKRTETLDPSPRTSSPDGRREPD